MALDIHAKSSDLLERLANSIYDREKEGNILKEHFTFSSTEMRIVESWILDLLQEFKQAMA